MKKLSFIFLAFILVSCNTFSTTENSPPTSILTQTSSPTFFPTQGSELIHDLYETNGGCELPYLLGITPGKTSVQDVYSRFSQIGYFDDMTRAVDTYQHIAFATIVTPNDLVGTYYDKRWGFSMRVENDTVVGILTGANDIKEFPVPSLLDLLTDFGQPEEIWMMVIESMITIENPDYVIALYYPSKGIFISWRGETESVLAQTEKDMTVMACLQYMPTAADQRVGAYPPFFYFFSPDREMHFDELIKVHLSEDPGGPYQALDKASVEKFYAMYLDPTNQDCFPLLYSFTN